MPKSSLRVRFRFKRDTGQIHSHQDKRFIGSVGIGPTSSTGRGSDQQIQFTQQLQLTTDMWLGHPQQNHQLLDRQRSTDRQAEDAQACRCAESSEQPGNRLSLANQDVSGRSFQSLAGFLRQSEHYEAPSRYGYLFPIRGGQTLIATPHLEHRCRLALLMSIMSLEAMFA